MKRAAVIGAGLVGLASAWYLLDHFDVTIYDLAGVGGGASGAATGLLHPFSGRLALHSWRAEEGMKVTRELLDVAEEALQKPVALRSGILRLAVADYQKVHFQTRVEEYPETKWWSEEEVAEHLTGFVRAPGFWIPNGVTVFMRRYLEGLWLACQRRGATLVQERITDLSELEKMDVAIVATGAQSPQLVECPSFELVKGQAIVCHWNRAPLPWSVSSQGHLSPTEDPLLCEIGSTYEHQFSHPNPTSEGEEELRYKIGLFYPEAQKISFHSARAGIRLCPKQGYRPLVKRNSLKSWIITGFGSKGLIYHGLLSSDLIKMIIKEGV